MDRVPGQKFSRTYSWILGGILGGYESTSIDIAAPFYFSLSLLAKHSSVIADLNAICASNNIL